MGKLVRTLILLGVLVVAGAVVYNYAAQAKRKPAEAPAAKPGPQAQAKPGDGTNGVTEKYGFTTEGLNH